MDGPCVPGVLAWLGLRQRCQIEIVCSAWFRASRRHEAWEDLRLSASWPVRLGHFQGAAASVASACHFGLGGRSGDSREAPPEHNIRALGDEALYQVAARLQEAARSATSRVVHVLPARPEAGEGARRDCCASQLEVCRICFGMEDFWFLQYNTSSFGWFHEEHVAGNQVAWESGLKVWAPTLVLCRFLCGELGPSAGTPSVRQRRCLELGAGVGVLSVVLSALGATEVVSTEADDLCLRVAAVNARLNGVPRVGESRFACHHLEWGAEESAALAVAHGRFDFIFGADVLYYDSVAVPLFETVSELLEPGGCFYLGYVGRHCGVNAALRQAAQEAGFVWSVPRPIGEELERHSPAMLVAGCPVEGGRGPESGGRVVLYRFVRRNVFRLDDLD